MLSFKKKVCFNIYKKTFKAAADIIRVSSQVTKIPQSALPIIFADNASNDKHGIISSRPVKAARRPAISK